MALLIGIKEQNKNNNFITEVKKRVKKENFLCEKILKCWENT